MKAVLARQQQEHAIHMLASKEMRPFLDEAEVKMVEFVWSLFNEEPLVLVVICIFRVDLLLCNDSIKVLLGSKLVHEGIKHKSTMHRGRA